MSPAGLLKTHQGSQMALVVSVPAELDPSVHSDCSSDGADRTWGIREEPTGSPCHVCSGSCESYPVVRLLPKEQGCMIFLPSFPSRSFLFVVMWPWVCWNLIPQSWCSCTFHFQRCVTVSGPSSAPARKQCPASWYASWYVVRGIPHGIISLSSCSVSTSSRWKLQTYVHQRKIIL